MTIDIKDVVKVIKACKASGVSQLKLGDLELKFETGEAVKPSVPETVDTVETPSAEKLKEIEETAEIQAAANDADDELAQMLIDDPSQFEDLLVQRELTNGGPSEIIEAENRRLEQDVFGR